MSWINLTAEQTRKLKLLYDQYPTGRDSLWAKYKETYPNEKTPSQRSILNCFLIYQEAHQTQLKPQKQSSIAPLQITKPGYLQADLFSMRSYPDAGYTAAFLMIDGFTKRVWGQPLRGESEAEVSHALKTCLQRARADGATFSACQSDFGSHFQSIFTRVLTDNNIKHFYSAPGRPQSNAIIERKNGVVKVLLYKQMIINKDKKWVKRFQTVLDNINQTKSFATHQSPIDLQNGSNEVQDQARAQITKNLGKRYKLQQRGKPLCIGQTVRRKRILTGSVKKPGVGGFWNEEIYTIAARINSTYANFLPSYKLINARGQAVPNRVPKSDLLAVPPILAKDQAPNPEETEEERQTESGENIESAFLQANQQNTAIQPAPEVDTNTQPRRSLRVQNRTRGEDEYEIDSIRGKRTYRKKLQYKVGYSGYGREDDRWVDATYLRRTAPQLVEEYEDNHS